MKYTYNDLVTKLLDGVLNITFEKVDGTERTMQCTLRPEYLPEEYRGKAPMLTETTPLTISVWDVEKSGWRSFRVENVTAVF
jgi:WYL_2, Sm-like SH3 beta-barrel fold